MPNFACIVDRDFSNDLEEYESGPLPLHPYENADLEAMLTRMNAFRALLLELGSEDKIVYMGGAEAVTCILQDIVAPITRLRAANAAMGWGLAFDKVDLADKIDIRTLSLNLDGYCSALISKNPDPPPKQVLLSFATGRAKLPYEPKCPRGSNPYYRGRDLLAAAGVALRKKIGSCDKSTTGSEHLARILRAIGCQQFANSTWSEELQELLSSNT
ncbi:hypothetical protein [Micromonospora pallida]|nr:hypothetical protein [Micromonospora pallida]